MNINEMKLDELMIHRLATEYRISKAKGYAKKDLYKHLNKINQRIGELKK